MLHDDLDVDPDNADIMSLLDFSYRKTQNYDAALTFSEWALEAWPEDKSSNAYMDEL